MTIVRWIGLRISALMTLRLSAVLTLIGLAFMVWSMVEPTPLPVMLAMTVGQGVGTVAFAIYAFIVVRELRRELRRGRSRDPS
jgi:membrane protein implicated in regulation of membrane protease activity